MIESVNIVSALGGELSEGVVEWALGRFPFRWGQSTLGERLQAIREHVGGMERLAELTEMSVSGLKAWMREKPSEPGLLKILQLSNATGITLDYIARGTMVSAKDLEVEEVRFELARRAGPQTSDLERRTVLNEIKRQLGLEWEQILKTFDYDRPVVVAQPLAQAQGQPAPAGYVYLPPINVQEHRVGTARVWQLGPAPVAFSAQLIESLGVKVETLGFDIVAGDTMAPRIAQGAIVVVNRADQELVSGCVYAIGFPGELVYRIFNRFLGGSAELVCHNDRYPPQPIAADAVDQLDVRGRVIWTGGAL